MKLGQKKGMSLNKYLRKAIRIRDNLGPEWDQTAATMFIMGIHEEVTWLLVMSIGKLDSEYTFTDAIKAAKAVIRGTNKGVKMDNYDESSSDEQSTGSSEEDTDSEEERRRRRKKKGKLKGVVIDQAGLRKLVQEMMKSSNLAKIPQTRTPPEMTNQFTGSFGIQMEQPQQAEVFAVGRQQRPGVGQQGGYYPGQQYPPGVSRQQQTMFPTSYQFAG